jgi:hypothetical protein
MALTGKRLGFIPARLVGYSKEVRNLRDLASLLVNGGGGGNRISASVSNIPKLQWIRQHKTFWIVFG